MRVAIVFPGQGTQETGMGRPWRDHPAWALVERAEKALGEPLAPLLLDAPPEALSQPREAQLAVLVTSLVAWEACRQRLTEQNAIVGCAGHSLGQVTALVAAGVLDPDDAVRFTARRGAATGEAARRHPGRMAALIGATPEQASEVCAGEDCWVANDNAPGQIVIAGRPEALARSLEAARSAGVRRALPLDVGGAFHTPLMATAAGSIRRALAGVDFGQPAFPVVSNADARAHAGREGWGERLVEHVTAPVRWRESMATLAGLGAAALVEIGHGAMIAGLARRARPPLPVVGVGSPADLAGLDDLAGRGDERRPGGAAR